MTGQGETIVTRAELSAPYALPYTPFNDKQK